MEIGFSLAKNALSSLHIAVEHFKAFYYYSLEDSKFEEEVKIAISFLENAIELLLKTILADNDEKSIFVNPDCEAISNAIQYVDEDHSLFDVLIEERFSVRTIYYKDAVEAYNKLYHNSIKVKTVLDTLGLYRNSLTHFGIRFASYDEIVCVFINTFDVIYNYLYPQLCGLNEIGQFFMSDDLVVKTIHGYKPLFDENFVYNNFLDFFDELLGDGNTYLLSLCRENRQKNIQEYEDYVDKAIESKKLAYIQEKFNVSIQRETLDDVPLFFSFAKGGAKSDIFIRYLPYYNAGVYFNDGGTIMFIVLFSERCIYIYKEKAVYPDFDEMDMDYQWLHDEQLGLCTKCVLSKNNIIKAFESIIEREFD